MTLRAGLLCLALSAAVHPQRAAAQEGSLEGRVRESWGRGLGVAGARVQLLGSSVSAVTDYKGRYRLAAVPAGPQAISVVANGYRSAEQREIPVYVGTQTRQDFFLPSDTTSDVPRIPPPVVDPRSRSTRHREVAADFSSLPITTTAEAVQLWSPAQSFRGGRPGVQVLVLDGLPITNDYDASTSPLGLRIPADLLWEAVVDHDPVSGSAATATAGIIGLTMRDGDSSWTGGIRYATDRPFSGSADLGYDRVAGHAEGSFGHARFIAGVDAVGRLQADASGAPVGEPGTPLPWALPHNSAETVDGVAKVTLPLGTAQTLRLIGVYSRERRELFDPAFEYATTPGDGRAMDALWISAALRRLESGLALTTNISYFARTLTEGALVGPPRPIVGALGGSYEFLGAEIARTEDTAAARNPIPGYLAPTLSSRTPWGVPAFFVDQGSRGVLRWTRYSELRAGLSVVFTRSAATSLGLDVSGAVGHVRSFARMLAFLPVGDSVPPATSTDLHPVTFTVATRLETPWAAGVLQGGLRMHGVAPGGGAGALRVSLDPYVKIDAPIGSARIFAGVGRTSRFPDFQFLGDVAFDDSLAGGRFRRRGNALGFESLFWQEFGVAARPWNDGAITLTAFRRGFSDLVASTTDSVPDSAAFVNQDANTALGLELTVEKALGGTAGLTVSASVANLDLGARNGFYQTTTRTTRTEKWIHSLLLVAHGSWHVRTEGSIIVRIFSSEPFTPIPLATHDAAFTIDALLRRSITVGSFQVWGYVDARNLLGHRGGAAPNPATVDGWAQDAYARAPQPIPYDSPRYRASADLDGNGLVEGDTELLPLYRGAARDFGRPLMSVEAPRTLRLGVALQF